MSTPSAEPGPERQGDMPGPKQTPAKATSMGIDPPVAGLLAYALGWVSGLVIFLIEKQHREVRFHGAQSVVLFGGLTILNILLSVFSTLPAVGWIIGLVGLLIWPLTAVLWIVLMIQGHKLNHVKLPVVGDIAERMVADQPGETV